MKKIIKSIKYRLVTAAFQDVLSLANTRALAKIANFWTIVRPLQLQPIPLHISRFRERGFNQASRISSYLSEQFDLPEADLLTRKKATPPQAMTEDRSKRWHNMRGAFSSQPTLYSLPPVSSVVLVDDVTTSGATLAEAAWVLKRKGVQKVFAFTLAKS